MTAFSDDIAIDLGTANTLVYVRGRGVLIDEPSVVAVSIRRGRREICAVGAAAARIIGKTPEPLELVKPLRDGVIADFVAAEEILRQFIRRARTALGVRRPHVLVSSPAGATPVEQRAIVEAAREAGARKVSVISEPAAAALGAGLPVREAFASMIVDIGGGTADLAVLRRDAVIEARSARCAGHAMDGAIVRHVRRAHGIAIDEARAERIKIEIGRAGSGAATEPIAVQGRDVRTERLRAIALASAEVVSALDGPIGELAEFIERALDELPPKARAEIEERRVCLAGGGALLAGLAEELERRLRVAFFTPRDPLRAVIKGSSMVLDDFAEWEHLLIRV